VQTTVLLYEYFTNIIQLLKKAVSLFRKNFDRSCEVDATGTFQTVTRKRRREGGTGGRVEAFEWTAGPTCRCLLYLTVMACGHASMTAILFPAKHGDVAVSNDRALSPQPNRDAVARIFDTHS